MAPKFKDLMERKPAMHLNMALSFGETATNGGSYSWGTEGESSRSEGCMVEMIMSLAIVERKMLGSNLSTCNSEQWVC